MRIMNPSVVASIAVILVFAGCGKKAEEQATSSRVKQAGGVGARESIAGVHQIYISEGG